ncbi:hypothetical protein NSA47_11615 [Irregularibacter muris]|uniref:Uncharacterized protein n=1 Tax=Irregularibacter muris TaxID=1796619 RepID=A0AAE3L300_9FIRM|nr:hypothetical protein [Irregularibacter muris]MCR1899624.1 hypothetical protein [Irregularibacter muris]
MNICLKYCGGCNSRYDRNKVIEQLNKKFSNINFVTNLDQDGVCDFVIVLSGCPSSCVNHKHLNGRFGKMIIRDLKDYEDLESKLEKVIKKGAAK